MEQPRKKRKYTILNILAGIGSFFVAMTLLAETFDEPLIALEQRVEQRWQALLQRDYAGAYEFHSPVYRTIFPLEQFMRVGIDSVPATDFEIVRIELHDGVSDASGVDVQAAMVVVDVDYRVPLSLQSSGRPINMTNTYRERWLLREGQWWYITRS